jgi:hypothetical protein
MDAPNAEKVKSGCKNTNPSAAGVVVAVELEPALATGEGCRMHRGDVGRCRIMKSNTNVYESSRGSVAHI